VYLCFEQQPKSDFDGAMKAKIDPGPWTTGKSIGQIADDVPILLQNGSGSLVEASVPASVDDYNR
jgi:hypothetical protein